MFTAEFRLPQGEFRSFDYGTISDLVLHLRYTARDGGESARIAALAAVPKHAVFSQLMSLKHEFPREIAAMSIATPGKLTIGEQFRPYLCRSGYKLRASRGAFVCRDGSPEETAGNARTVDGDTVQLVAADLDLGSNPHLVVYFEKV
jgi:hypothetical protein